MCISQSQQQSRAVLERFGLSKVEPLVALTAMVLVNVTYQEKHRVSQGKGYVRVKIENQNHLLS